MRVTSIHSSKVNFLSVEGDKIEFYPNNDNYWVGQVITYNGQNYTVDRISVRRNKTFVVAYS